MPLDEKTCFFFYSRYCYLWYTLSKFCQAWSNRFCRFFKHYKHHIICLPDTVVTRDECIHYVRLSKIIPKVTIGWSVSGKPAHSSALSLIASATAINVGRMVTGPNDKAALSIEFLTSASHSICSLPLCQRPTTSIAFNSCVKRHSWTWIVRRFWKLLKTC